MADDPHARARARLAPYGDRLEVREGPFGELVVAARRDMTHLEADALSDRLVAWARREAGLPEARGEVSFHHARPADDHAPESDLEAAWRDVDALWVLDAAAPPARVEAFLALVPRFLEVVEASGRPPGFRQPDHGGVD